ncbi:MAG: E2/UBC family protein [Pseudomonas sp.]|nr:E2/UBC family protein [Pseudomonas sp.]
MVGVLRTTTQGEVCCEIWIDRSLIRALQVRLIQIPDRLPRLVPHLGPDGFLCYVAPGTEVVDIYDPVTQTRTSLLQAAHVLEQILAGKMVEDLQEEFFVFWRGDYCIHDIERRSSGPLEGTSKNRRFPLKSESLPHRTTCACSAYLPTRNVKRNSTVWAIRWPC